MLQSHASPRKAKVEVYTDLPVTECDASGVVQVSDGSTRKPWSGRAGVKASPAATWLKADADGVERVKVDEALTSLPGASPYLRNR